MSDPRSRQQRAQDMKAEREKAQKRQRNLISLAIVVVVVALVATAGYAISQASKDSSAVVQPANASKDHFVTVGSKDLGGSANPAAVAVDLYVDLQCPACKAFEEQYGPRLESLAKAGDISLRYKVVNFLDGQSTTKYSSRAANTSLCVLNEAGTSGFYSLIKRLYEVQPAERTAGLPDDQLLDLGVDAGASESALKKCISDQTYVGWVNESTDQFGEKYSSTPTVVIGGKEIDVTSFANIEKAIKADRSA